MLAPASSTKDAAICVTAKIRSRRLVLPVMRRLPLDEAEAMRRVGRWQARNERQQHRRHDRQHRADPEQAGIHRQIERADGEARGVAGQDGDHRPRDQHAERRAGAAQQQAFRQQRAAQRAGTGAERGADRQFAFAADRPRQNQVGDVRARDDEDQPDAASSTSSTVRAREVIWSRRQHGVDAEVRFRRIGFGMLA